jgi:hypothetical protein
VQTLLRKEGQYHSPHGVQDSVTRGYGQADQLKNSIGVSVGAPVAIAGEQNADPDAPEYDP